QVVHAEPVPPRRFQPQLPRDLETVCLKCLQKEPRKRYATAEALADDLRRFLQDLPVQARPAGKPERLVRWCRRNPRVAGLLAFLVLVVGGAAAAWPGFCPAPKARRGKAESNQDLASQAKDTAEKNYRLALQAVDDYCTKVSADPRLREKDMEPLRKELLQTAVPFYEKLVAQRSGDPQVRAELAKAYTRLATLTAAIDDKAKAIGYYRQALTVWGELASESPTNPQFRARQADCHHQLAALYRETGRPGDAEKAHGSALRIREPLVRNPPNGADFHSPLPLSNNSFENLHRRNKEWAKAEVSYTKALQTLQHLTGRQPENPGYQLNL